METVDFFLKFNYIYILSRWLKRRPWGRGYRIPKRELSRKGEIAHIQFLEFGTSLFTESE